MRATARVAMRRLAHMQGVRTGSTSGWLTEVGVYTRIGYASRLRATTRTPLHYGWIVAGVTMVVLVTTAGFRSMAGVLIVPLHDDFGWSHGTISIAVSLSLLSYGLFAPFAAALHERQA